MGRTCFIALGVVAAVSAAGCDEPPLESDEPFAGGSLAVPDCGFEVQTGHLATSPALAGEDMGPDPTPRQIHLGGGGDLRTHIAVTWRTDEATTAGALTYGPVDGALDQVAPSLTWRYKDRAGVVVRIHEAHLCGLAPDTAYRYRVGSGPVQSDERTFRTAPDFATQPDGEVVLAVLGDARGRPEVLGAVLGMLDETGTPDYVVFTGDWVVNGTNQSEWDEVFAHPAVDALLRRVPVLTTIGNHETGAVGFLAQFALPGDERFFSVDLGAVHLAVADDSTYLSPDQHGAGREFLARDLAEDRPQPWTFVMNHQPLYSAGGGGNHGPTYKLQAEWGPLLSEHGVDLVLSGHDHKYERTVPIGGVTYIVTGGAGAPPYDAIVDERWTHTTDNVEHGLLVRVRAGVVEVTAHRVDGTVLDAFSLYPNGRTISVDDRLSRD